MRRTLRRLEPEALKETKQAILDGAMDILVDMAMAAPRDTGKMWQSIDYKLGRDGLTAVIGPGASMITISKNPFDTTVKMSKRKKDILMQFFKAYWIEFGTKGNAAKNIPAQPARPFITPAFDRNKAKVLKNVQNGISLALKKAAEGNNG